MSDPTPPPLPSQSAASPAKTTPGLAIASLVLGILSMMGGAVLIIPMVLAIIFGHIALSKIDKNPNLTGRGLAITGLVLGYTSILFGIIMAGLLAAMAIPAFQKVRETSMRKTMDNDARQIGAAAQQLMSENGEKPVIFHIDPVSGKVSGPISVYVMHVTRGTVEVDGTIENTQDTFSLRNPRTYQGKEMVFDAEGRLSTK